MGDLPHLIRPALERALQGTDIPETIREQLFQEFRTLSEYDNNPRAIDKAFAQILRPITWQWREFEAWKNQFEAWGAFPYMWERCNQCEEPPELPTSAEESVQLLTAPQIRAALKQAGDLPKPAPKTRESLEDIYLNSAKAHEAARPVWEEKFRATSTKREDSRKDGMAHLLSHYAMMIAYRSRQQNGAIVPGSFPVADGIDEIEKRVCQEFNAGKRSDWPPYFPGDRSSVFWNFADGERMALSRAAPRRRGTKLKAPVQNPAAGILVQLFSLSVQLVVGAFTMLLGILVALSKPSRRRR